jgi:hypothetical protein
MSPSRSIVIVIVIALAACKTPGTPPPDPAPNEAVAPGARIEKIVFVDMAEACECTNKRTAKSWEALEAALGSTTIALERIHMDEDDAKAAVYTAKKPMVTAPAVYFLDAQGNILTVLQGEITQSQFEKVLTP